jgi:hypothetical protein
VQIPVYRHSDVAQLAAAFAAKHGLPKKMTRRLEKLLAAQRDAVLVGEAQS